MKEKILFVNFNCNWCPHFETELEIMLNKKNEGHDVYSLSCNTVLNKFCISNENKTSEYCQACQNRLVNGFDLIGLFKRKQLKLQAVDCPDFPIFNSMDELKNFSIDGINIGFGVASSLIAITRDHLLSVSDYITEIHLLLKNACTIVQNLNELQGKYHFDSIYIFNGRFAEYYGMLSYCKKNKIDFYLHERGSGKNKYQIIKNNILHSRLRCQDEIEEFWHKNSDDVLIPKKVQKWFEERRNGAEQNWVSFTAEQEKNRLPKNFNPSQYNIAIFNSSLDEIALFDDWNSKFESDYIVVKTLTEHYQNDKNKHFYLRIHPNLKNLKTTQMDKIRELAALNLPNLTVIMPEDEIDTYALMDSCQKVVTFGSTVGIEATYWGKVSILAGKATYDDLDCVYAAEDYETLYKYIDLELASKPRENCNKYIYWVSNRGIPFRYFQATGLFSGTFLGFDVASKRRKIGSRIKRKILAYFHRLYIDYKNS